MSSAESLRTDSVQVGDGGADHIDDLRCPSEVLVGIDEGLKRASAVNLDHVQTVERTRLVSYIGSASPATMNAVGRALAVATGCAD